MLSRTKNNDYILAYRPQFDGLRFCAVLLVMVYHYFTFLNPVENDYDLGTFIALFFVLSSYLITKILIIAKQKGLEKGYSRYKIGAFFVIRRALRIFPAYYFYLGIVMLLPFAGIYLREHAGMYLSYLGNFQLFIDQQWEPLTTHLWTLAVEEQFYITWPWLILFIPDRYLYRAFIGIIAAGILFRFIFYAFTHSADTEIVTMTILTPACLDAFGFGALLAWRHLHGKTVHPILSKLFIAGLPVWILLNTFHYTAITIGFNRVFAELFALIIIEGANNGYKNIFGRFLENRQVRYLGKISYGIYLYHLLVPFAFWKIFSRVYYYVLNTRGTDLLGLANFLALPWISFWVYLLLTVLMAAASWHLLEVPVNRLKRFVGSSSRKADSRKP